MFKRIFIAMALFMAFSTTSFATAHTLAAACDATWPPFEYISSDGQIIGYSIDYLDAVGKEAGFKVEHHNVPWAVIFSELAAGKYDVIASSVSITDERKYAMDFSLPYYTVKQAVLVRKGFDISTSADLEGRRIGAQINTTGFFAARKIKDSNSMSYDSVELAIEALHNNKLDAVICDGPVAAEFAMKKAESAVELDIAFILEDAEVELYGFVVRKGDKENLALLDKGIEAVKAKGIEAELQEKWIGAQNGQ